VAMVILSIFVIPIYYRLKVYTAYEYLEGRFDVRTRTLTAILFLLQRGLAAGITIYAPAIILSSILGWGLNITIFFIGLVVIFYTVMGGTQAVSVTQKQQMIVILSGMFVAAIILVNKLPPEVSFVDAVGLAGRLDKLTVVDFSFDWNNRYTFWSGMLGGVFLFLSYFGTDQSQVQRYLSGKSLTESRLGLLFNGILKVPMQFLVLFVGILVFVFFQFNTTPFDAELYDQKIAQFEQNEEIAVSTFSLLDSVSNEGILIYINQKAMPALQHNEELVKELNYIQFLPQELIDQNALLSQINFKRKESLQLMQDYLISGVDNIDAFNQKQEEIDALIEQVNNLY